ncbi:YDG domain-containing protein [Janthinobacterium sp. LB2P10]|uniref:YDG domain-containing protein n=1 Tax=Janthinobacterium sp. LB2P10 TaxID=3424194 RepID=UPI003F266FCD
MHNHVQHASASILTPSFSSPFAPPMRRTALALLLAGCFGVAQANPASPQLVHGQATFSQQGNVLSITNTPNTIINWQSFSIHAGEITRFIQQNGTSAVLNRITGQDPSKILGALESNGKVFLINPNGIVFGQGAKVDVNALLASSLGMSNDDFLSGKGQFTAGSVAGGVSNAGVINAGKGGQVLLIAPNVENTGIITAPNGEVILAAGHSVQLADPGNPQLRVLVSAPNDQALNLGQIIAHGGSIGMAGALVSQRGVLNANSAVLGEHGTIVLKASGKALLEAGSATSATGAAGKGGEISVLGEQVGLLGNASIDASGATGGGTVLLGGDYQGKNAAVQNARQVLVGKDASVHADAIDSGNGGKIIAWGNASAQVHGSLSARGGAQGGDGGLVETSGHYLAVDGIRVDTSARSGRGKRGNWLLDPFDIDIVQGNGGNLEDVNQFMEGPPASSTSIGADTISAASSNVILQAQHRINFSAAVNMLNPGIGLSATAGETINVYAAITTNGGNVSLSANDASSGAATGPGANVNLNAPITSNGGNISLSGAGVAGAAAVNVGNGNLSLRANQVLGGISLSGGANQLSGSGIAGQTVTLQADNVTLGGGIDVGGTAGGANVIIKPLSSSRSIDLGSKSGTALSLNAIELAAISASSLTIGDGTNTGGISISDALARTGDLHFNAAATITATGAVTVGGSFVLDGGNWVQNAATLPAFSARSFAIGSGASFLRAVGGDGVTAPYLLADIYGLQGIASLDLGNSYRLAGNIDASGTSAWNGDAGFRPIAHSDSGGFSGLLDGAGYAVSGLQIHGASAPNGNLNTGLFGKLGNGTTGTVRQLNLLGGNVSGNNNVGAVAGVVAAGGTIEQVQSSMNVAGQDGVGGLAGINRGRIAVSYASGGVSGARNVGGLVGSNQGTLADVYATGAVGVAGNADAGLAREHIGGLAGENTGSISNAYASGAIAGGGFSAVGGLVGSNSGALASTYWNMDSSGQAHDGGASIGRTAAQMSRLSSFDGFVFGAAPVWRIYDGYTSPMLRAFLKPLQVTLSGSATGKVYDGQLATFLGSIAYTGLVDGDVGVNGSLGYGSSARNVGNYAATGLWSTKYDISLGGTTSFAITPRALNYSVTGAQSRVYDGSLHAALNGYFEGVVTGDQVSMAGLLGRFRDRNVGTGKNVDYQIATGHLTGADAGNYVLYDYAGSTTADIGARALNLSGAAGNKVYDGTTGAQLNLLGDDRLAGDRLTASVVASFADKNVGAGKTVQLSGATLTGADAGNYFIVLPTGLLASITPASLTLAGVSATDKVYDGTTSATVSASVNGVLGRDVVNVVGGSGNFADKNAGTGKLVTASGFRLAGADAGNYTLQTTGATAQATIAQKQMSTWIGSGNGLWSDAANWDGGVVPEGANVLAVDFSRSKGIVTYSAAAGSTFLKRLTSATGLLLTGGELSLGESALDGSVLGGLAGLEINGGSLLLNGSLSAQRYAQGGGVLSGNGNLLVANSFSQAAGAIGLAGQLAITQASGDLRFASLAANEVRLSALNGAIGQDGALRASSLTAQAQNGIVLGNTGNQVGSFTASNSAAGGIALNNTSAPGKLLLGPLLTGAGNIAIDNTGGIAAGNINANGGNITLTAHSPVTVNGKLIGNDITLNASTDMLLGEGAQLAAARDISLVAGGDIGLEGNAQVLGGRNFSASAAGNVRFADTASLTVPAVAGMSVLAKTGSITGTLGVRFNRQRADVSLLAPKGTVAMPDPIFLPAATIYPLLVDASVVVAIDNALRVIKQADRANDPLASIAPVKNDDKTKDSKDVAGDTGKSTGYKYNDSIKKTYCN